MSSAISSARARSRTSCSTSLTTFGDLGLLLVELDLAGLELRDVENVADDAEKMLRAGADVARIAGIARAADRAHHLVRHHLGEADDGVQRRAQLVAHIGEELGLAAARELGFLLGGDERQLGGLAVGDVERGGDDERGRPPGRAAAPWW